MTCAVKSRNTHPGGIGIFLVGDVDGINLLAIFIIDFYFVIFTHILSINGLYMHLKLMQ